MKGRLCYTILFIFFLLAEGSAQRAGERRNVLFIFVDDLRPDLGCYGNPIVKTPNLDKLAATSVVFLNHYVQVPTCGASRFSLLTGMLPQTRAHLRNDAIERFIAPQPEGPRPETFIHHLRRSGYYTVGIGKISHSADGLVYPYTGNPEGAKRELPHSWDELLFDSGKWGTGWNAFFGYADGANRQSRNNKVKPYENAGLDDEDYPDGLTASLAIEKLTALAEKETPFFMGVGFFKPHLPLNAPKKYWDLYKESEIPLTPSPDLPANVNTASLHNSAEFNSYHLGDEHPSLSQPVSEAYARRIRHAYYASVSYADAQIGRVLARLDQLGLSEKTIVVVWGDHGWHLGDHRVWGKHTIFERALRSPLIIKAPGLKRKGHSSKSVVSSVDIYPSLMALCGVEMPYQSDGQSFVPLLNDKKGKAWKNRAFGYFNSGVTLRTRRFRLTRYMRDAEPSIELYDHRKDPYENHNIAGNHPARVRKLMVLLGQGYRGLNDGE